MSVPLILLSVILMRLVWMQLRHYPLQFSSRALAVSEVVRSLSGRDCMGSRQLAYTAVPVLASSPELIERERLRPLRSMAMKQLITGPGYGAAVFLSCQRDVQGEHSLIVLNKVLLMMSIFCATLMTRFICSSWTVALIVAGMLLSRGRLQAEIGTISPDYLVMFGVTAWLMCCAHFLRTGATLSSCFAILAAAFAATADVSCLLLFVTVPTILVGGYFFRRQMARPVIKRLRAISRRRRVLRGIDALGAMQKTADVGVGKSPITRMTRSVRWFLGMEFPTLLAPNWRLNFQPGDLFRTLEIPFLLWAYWQRRWARISLSWLSAGVAAAILIMCAVWFAAETSGLSTIRQMVINRGHTGYGVTAWWYHLQSTVDGHFLISLVVIVLCAWQSPAAGLPSFFEWTWLTIVTLICLVGASFGADRLDFQVLQSLFAMGDAEPWLLHLQPRGVTLWLEPAVLGFGVSGAYNLMKVLDSRIA